MGLFTGPLVSKASTCDAVEVVDEDTTWRPLVLNRVKSEILSSTHQSTAHLLSLRECFLGDNQACGEFETTAAFKQFLIRQFAVLKRAEAIARARPSNLYQLSRQALVRVLRERPEVLEGFASLRDVRFHFTQSEKDAVVRIWRNSLLLSLGEEIEQGLFGESEHRDCLKFNFEPVPEVLKRVSFGYQSLVDELHKSNPLLFFLTEEGLSDQRVGLRAFDRLLESHASFMSQVLKLQTYHSDSLWTYPSLILYDHEMGLMNFDPTISSMISKLAVTDQPKACASIRSLKAQQSNRVVSSIAVGFATATACGVGIWSGVGTAAAAASCLPAMGDSLLGGYRGMYDGNLAERSQWIGRGLSSTAEGSALKPLRSIKEAEMLKTRANIVALINFAGLAPVLHGVSLATKGATGTIGSLAKLPAADSTVSLTEVNSGLVAFSLILGVRSLEAAVKLPQSTSVSLAYNVADQCLAINR